MQSACRLDELQQEKSTLLMPEDFAAIVLYAIEGKYAPGEHINVTLQNVGDLLNA